MTSAARLLTCPGGDAHLFLLGKGQIPWARHCPGRSSALILMGRAGKVRLSLEEG